MIKNQTSINLVIVTLIFFSKLIREPGNLSQFMNLNLLEKLGAYLRIALYVERKSNINQFLM